MSILDSLNNAISEFRQVLSETSIVRWKNLVYAKYGFIVISAYRGDKELNVNNHNTKLLLRDIRDSGYQYHRADGYYVEIVDDTKDDKDPENLREVAEKSFIVVNMKEVNGVWTPLEDFDALKQLGIEWCGKYDQDSVLVVRPGGKACFYDRYGEKSKSMGFKGAGRRDDFHILAGYPRKHRKELKFGSFVKGGSQGFIAGSNKDVKDARGLSANYKYPAVRRNKFKF